MAKRSTAFTERTAVFPDTPEEVSAPLFRNVWSNQIAHAAAVGLWIVNLTPLYQCCHWLSWHATRRTRSSVDVANQRCICRLVTWSSAATIEADSWLCPSPTVSRARA